MRRGFRLQNIKLLSQYARQKVEDMTRIQIRAFLQAAQAPICLGDLARTITPMTSLFCLAYHHEIELALDEAPISGATLVSSPLRKPQEGKP